jgi:hypothetical protein
MKCQSELVFPLIVLTLGSDPIFQLHSAESR